jgi:hypothetical protein
MQLIICRVILSVLKFVNKQKYINLRYDVSLRREMIFIIIIINIIIIGVHRLYS